MADYENLPGRIKRVAKTELHQNEHIDLCVLGRSSVLRPDYVIITSLRILVIDERDMGSLAISYANIRCNLFYSEITAVKLARLLKHRLLGQARLEINVKRNVHWIDNLSYAEAKQVHSYIDAKIQN